MSVLKWLRNNRFVKVFWRLYNNYFSAIRSKFGHCGQNVKITPPYSFHKKIEERFTREQLEDIYSKYGL